MIAKSMLEEIYRRLGNVKDDALDSKNFQLESRILDAMHTVNSAIALADPGKEWVEEVKREAWQAASPAGSPYDELEPHNLIMCDRLARFAASIAAGELRKYTERCGHLVNPVIQEQIADLEAIAKGGGE